MIEGLSGPSAEPCVQQVVFVGLRRGELRQVGGAGGQGARGEGAAEGALNGQGAGACRANRIVRRAGFCKLANDRHRSRLRSVAACPLAQPAQGAPRTVELIHNEDS